MSPVRRRFAEFVAAIAVLHGVAIAAYYAFDVQHAPPGHQRTFAWTWMGLTVGVIVVGLQRIKRARASRSR